MPPQEEGRMKASCMVLCLAVLAVPNMPAIAAGLNDNPGPSDGRSFERADEAERERNMARDELDRQAEARMRESEKAYRQSRHRTDRWEERYARDQAFREYYERRQGEDGVFPGLPSGRRNSLPGAPGGYPSRHFQDGMLMPEPPYPPMR